VNPLIQNKYLFFEKILTFKMVFYIPWSYKYERVLKGVGALGFPFFVLKFFFRRCYFPSIILLFWEFTRKKTPPVGGVFGYFRCL